MIKEKKNKFPKNIPTPIVLDGGNKNALSLRLLDFFACSIVGQLSYSHFDANTNLIKHIAHKPII